MNKENSKKLHFAYHIIACAIRGNPYNADFDVAKTNEEKMIKYAKRYKFNLYK